MSLPQPSRTILVEPVKDVATTPASSPPAEDEPPRSVEAPTAPPPRPPHTPAGL